MFAKQGSAPLRGRRAGLGGMAALLVLVGAGCNLPAQQGAQEPPGGSVQVVQRAYTTGPGVPNAVKPAATALGANIITGVSPSSGANPKVMSPGKHFLFSSIVNKALFIGGNASHEIWNISNPTAPVRMSNPDGACPTSATAPTAGTCELVSPFRDGEAESHQHSFSLFPDGSLHAVTASGRGIDLWNISDPAEPRWESSYQIAGVDYGDSTAAVWGVFFQGRYIYVGGTNTGLHVFDASNPANPILKKTVPVSAMGGVNSGMVWAAGNLLVITTPKNLAGVVTMDISNPENPVLLDSVVETTKSYSGMFYGKYAYLMSPLRTYDVTTNPAAISKKGSATMYMPNGSTVVLSEYMAAAGENQLFFGSKRTASGGVGGIVKYNIASIASSYTGLLHIPVRKEPDGSSDTTTDDQFGNRLGNLVVITDDENKKGAWLAYHESAKDVTGPSVTYVNPPGGATNQKLTTRIGVSFSDQVELTSASSSSFIVRPVGSTTAVTGRWGIYTTNMSFSPDAPLAPGTTYEIVLPAGGIKDIVGNGIAAQFRSTFTTEGTAPPAAPECAIVQTTPTPVGTAATLAASNVAGGYSYAWDYGDGTTGAGASTSKSYSSPGRYPVTLTMTASGSSTQIYEAETAALAGGVAAATSVAGYTGTGYADYPSTDGAGIKVTFNVSVPSAGSYTLTFRYANGSTGQRPQKLSINGGAATTINFVPTGAWTTWATITPTATLTAGANTVSIEASAGEAGANVDHLSITSGGGGAPASCSLTHIVHRPLTAARPTRSGTVALDGSRVWTVNPDANTVTAVSTSSNAKLFEVPVGQHPRTLARAADGAIWVVNQGSASVSVLDASNGSLQKTIALPPGSQPHGIVFQPGGGKGYVTLAALGRVVEVDPATATRALTGRQLDLPADAAGAEPPRVRALAVTADGARVLVARFISPDAGGRVYEVSASAFTLTRSFALASSTAADTPDSARGIPNYLAGITVSPDGLTAWVPSKQDNMSRGGFRDGQALNFEVSVRPVVSRLDLVANAEDLPGRVDINDADQPVAADISWHGDLVFVAVQGKNLVHVMDAYTGTQVAGIRTDLAPQGLALGRNDTADTGLLYVQSFMSRTLSVYDVGAILRGQGGSATRLAAVGTVAAEPLSAQVLLGKQVFYNAQDIRMSNFNYLSCATCHADGGDDGRVWDFTDRGEGLRNTASLQSRAGMGHGPVHWTGNFDEIQDFENDIRNNFGGTGFMTGSDFAATSDALGAPKAGKSAELDALAAYVASLAASPRSPYRNTDNTLTADGVAGRAIFLGRDCNSCHSGARLTDSALNLFHDVGTIGAGSGKRRGATLTGFDTPTLLGAFATAPYFHDGSAATLMDVINRAGHGNAQGLPQAEKDQLVAYLRQMDDSEATCQQQSCGCTSESNAAFCARLGATCGSLTATDNCGATRTVSSCGSCTSPQTCGGGGTANVCGAPAGQSPYGGTAWAIPGTVQAEDYDNGGQGVAYNDTTAGNTLALYRSDDVDVGSSCGSGCYNLNYVAAGEWVEYTVNVAATASYDLKVSAATTAARTLHVEVDGTNVTGTVTLPNTGAYTAFSTVTAPGIALGAGSRVVRLVMDGAMNVDWFSFTQVAACTPETDAAFCARAGASCGSVTAADNCGGSRTVASCGSCTSPQTCGGGGTANVCGGGATNLFTNPSFDSNTSGWITYFNTGCGPLSTDATGQDGTGSGKIAIAASYTQNVDWHAQVYQTKTSDGAAYNMTLYFQKAEGSSKSILAFCSEEGGDYTMWASKTCTNTSGWTQCTLTCTPPAGKLAKFGVSVATDNIDVRIDNLRLTR
jgi:cytochrome c peroxidase